MATKSKHTKIYRLICQNGFYYIGSTTQPLETRLKNHKDLSKTLINNVYIHINTIGWDNVLIELLEEYSYKTKKELNTREEYYINQTNDNLCLNRFAVNKYEYGKIYKIECNDGHYYIGSTTQPLCRRLYHHKQCSKKDNSNIYQHIRTIGTDNITIKLVEDYPCAIAKELRKREDEYIQQSKNDPLCLNQHRSYVEKTEIAIQSKKYYEEHKEEILEYHKKYNVENHNTILQKQQTYREQHRKELCEKQKAYVARHKDQVRQKDKLYREQHKEQTAIYHKNYVITHKEAVAKRKLDWQRKKAAEVAKATEKEREEKCEARKKKTEERKKTEQEIHTCECGGTYQFYRKNRHLISKKHMAFIE